jgi:hypothetical protein
VRSGGGASSAAMVVEKVKRSLGEEGKRNGARLREGGLGARLDVSTGRVHACGGLGGTTMPLQSGGSRRCKRTVCNSVFHWGHGALECAAGEATGRQAVGA